MEVVNTIIKDAGAGDQLVAQVADGIDRGGSFGNEAAVYSGIRVGQPAEDRG